jgi:hypothetical protein
LDTVAAAIWVEFKGPVMSPLRPLLTALAALLNVFQSVLVREPVVEEDATPIVIICVEGSI